MSCLCVSKYMRVQVREQLEEDKQPEPELNEEQVKVGSPHGFVGSANRGLGCRGGIKEVLRQKGKRGLG